MTRRWKREQQTWKEVKGIQDRDERNQEERKWKTKAAERAPRRLRLKKAFQKQQQEEKAWS